MVLDFYAECVCFQVTFLRLNLFLYSIVKRFREGKICEVRSGYSNSTLFEITCFHWSIFKLANGSAFFQINFSKPTTRCKPNIKQSLTSLHIHLQHVADPVLAAARWSPLTMISCALTLAYLWYSGTTLVGHPHALTGGVVIAAIAFILGAFFYVPPVLSTFVLTMFWTGFPFCLRIISCFWCEQSYPDFAFIRDVPNCNVFPRYTGRLIYWMAKIILPQYCRIISLKLV